MSGSIDLHALGRRIRTARKGQGLAQAQLAERAGTSVESVSRIERGALSPSFRVVARIAHELGLSLDELAGLTEGADHEQPQRRALARATKVIEKLDDSALNNLADFLRGVTAPRRKAPRSASRR